MNYWEADSYTIAELKQQIEDEIILIPSYQRGVVWNKKDQEKLINSIKNGYPFGAFLIYHDKKANQKQIIDGLQRATTIMNFTSDPGKYLSESAVSDESIETFLTKMKLRGDLAERKKQIKKLISDWIQKEFTDVDKVKSIQYYHLYKYMKEKDGTFENYHDEIIDTFEDELSILKELTEDIYNKKIPVIHVYGDEKNLPEIFKRINTLGKKLRKYEIYRATWTGSKINITSDILKKEIGFIKDYYDEIEGIDIGLKDESIIEELKEDKTTFFDLCFGFGKLLKQDFPEIFGENYKDITNIDGFVFTLINACLGQEYSEIEHLNVRIRTQLEDDKTINAFFDKIYECASIVSEKLRPYSEFKLNRQNKNKYGILHSQLQMVSIIVSVFLNRHAMIDYNENDEINNIEFKLEGVNPEWKQSKKKQFKKNIEKHYVVDIILRKWAGTGDKSLDNIVMDPTVYIKDLPEEYFKNTMHSWFQKQLIEKNEYRRVPEPSEAEKIVLKVIYMQTVNAKEQMSLDYSFDIEHVIPKKLIKDKLSKFNGILKVAIGSIGNLAILPSQINRSKKDKPIYEKNMTVKDEERAKQIADRYLFVDSSDFDFLNRNYQKAEVSKPEYEKFLYKRFDIILERMISELFD